jgi:toxin ParE1/3/4
MILRYSAKARVQLLAIHDHISKEAGPEAAARVGASIREAGEILRLFPNAGRPGHVDGTREWVVRQRPYIIVYEVSPQGREEVIVIGVFHSRQSRT